MYILGLVQLPAWLVGLLTLIFTVCIYTWYKQTYFQRRGITTKPTTFFLGDLPLFIKKGFGYVDAEMVQKYGKVFGTYTGNLSTLIISDTEMIKQITVKEFSNFTDKVELLPVTKKWDSALNLAAGAKWKFLRSTLSPTFSTGKIRHMSQYIVRCLKDLNDLIEENMSKTPEGFDIVPFVRGYTMDVICSTGFGIDVNAQRDQENAFIKHAKEFLEISFGFNPIFLISTFFPDLSFITKMFKSDIASKKCFDFFNAVTIAAFAERKESDTNNRDILQSLINAHKGNLTEETVSETDGHLSLEERKERGLTDEEVLINSLVFMIVGYDTTSATITWLIYRLVTHPECQETLIKEIDKNIGDNLPTYDSVFKLRYLDMVVSETLRMHPVIARINRVAKEDIEVCGVKIEKGTDCTFCASALHFMPEYWPNPNMFDPERFAPENKNNINDFAYMAFGLGPRNCIGQRLALLEVKMTAVSLLQRYRIFKTDKLEIPMPVAATALSRPAKPVVVRFERRETGSEKSSDM